MVAKRLATGAAQTATCAAAPHSRGSPPSRAASRSSGSVGFWKLRFDIAQPPRSYIGSKDEHARRLALSGVGAPFAHTPVAAETAWKAVLQEGRAAGDVNTNPAGRLLR